MEAQVSISELLRRLRGAADALDRLTELVDGTGFSNSDAFTNALDELDFARALIDRASGTQA